MNYDQETIEGYDEPDVLCIHETEKAMLGKIKGETLWILKSEVFDDSDVKAKGHQGKLVVAAWYAEERGWL